MAGSPGALLKSLGYREAYCIDTEFVARPGHKPFPVCLVAKCLITTREVRLWGEELSRSCPFDASDDVLFIAYYASAEFSFFDILGWPSPRRVIDLFAEFRQQTNGTGALFGNGLIAALLHFGLPTIGSEEKEEMRQLIMGGGPWTDSERAKILNYCESDVDALVRLAGPMLGGLVQSRLLFGQALLRGRYMAAAAIVENNGVPLDAVLLARLTLHWDEIKARLIERVDAAYGVYVDGSFSTSRFADLLARRGVAWPRLHSGQLALDDETFKKMTGAHPFLRPLRELRRTLSQLKLNDLAVGPDGRNRVMLSAFRAKTGRNQPSNSKFIFGLPAWVRRLIQPAEGRAIAYIDWSSQEIAIAGALSGDEALWDAYASGDPYIAFAIRAGLAPAGATKKSHPEIRQACKAIVLGVNYGMGAEAIAAQSGIHVVNARRLLRLHRETYRRFWAWADDNVNNILLGSPLETVFGWRIHYPPNCGAMAKSTSILNWPMQSHGAEMMRLAVSMAIDEGLMVCATIHDALLLEASVDEIDQKADRLAAIMGDASELVLGPGKRCRSDVKIVRYPERYDDDGRGSEMFKLVMELLNEAEAVDKPLLGLE
jgi:DNA polymerase-1